MLGPHVALVNGGGVISCLAYNHGLENSVSLVLPPRLRQIRGAFEGDAGENGHAEREGGYRLPSFSCPRVTKSDLTPFVLSALPHRCHLQVLVVDLLWRRAVLGESCQIKSAHDGGFWGALFVYPKLPDRMFFWVLTKTIASSRVCTRWATLPQRIWVARVARRSRPVPSTLFLSRRAQRTQRPHAYLQAT
jgi:hypothetical protein